MSLSPYRYTPLRKTQPSCRTVELLPGTFDEDICVRLHEIEITSEISHPYEALSYVLGTEDDPQ